MSETITVPGDPLPKERPRMGKHGGVYTPRKSVAYENAIGFTAKAAGWRFGSARLIVEMDFYCEPKPEQKKADLDNLIKAVLDGLQRGNAFKNDRQVVELVARRHDGQDNPRVEITMRSF